MAKAGDGCCSHAHLSKVERGLEWPSPQLVVSLETALSVPRGTFLAMLGRAETDRWISQKSYRSGVWWATPASAADTYARHFIHHRDEPPLPLVPRIIDDYMAPVAPPYLIVEQAIDYHVSREERRARTRITYIVEAMRDAVTT
ncbi:MAG: hypothetical protein QOE58_1894, partial [Actinomycetota bacterium]|nr:hypothetical protein [Actinomycetota bacterium]